jgi:peptide-methionine (S)-S-oxide reductase
MEKVTFGAGCFWHVEEVFRKIKGVVKTEVGFMGGEVEEPSYELVCSGRTGYVEVCNVEYDSKIISYKELLDVFWKMHDPTRYDGQGLDVGSQYKSVIFYYNDNQKALAETSKEEKQKEIREQIVTEIIPAKIFYRAEEYHQKYSMKEGKDSCEI